MSHLVLPSVNNQSETYTNMLIEAGRNDKHFDGPIPSPTDDLVSHEIHTVNFVSVSG
jgi:hypothetical protein